MFSAVLDTCVLYPSLQRDFLLSLAVQNLYRPLWSSEILAELLEHEAEKLREVAALPQAEAERRAARLVEAMRSAFDDAEVQNWEPYAGTFGLPDPDDEHVLAAALAGHAGAIVTSNLKDFPEAKVPVGIEILEPAEFAANTVAVAPVVALKAVTEISDRSAKPPRSVDEILDLLLARYGMDEAVDLMTDIS